MARIGVSRRKALEAGACALVGAAAFSVTARARARAGQSTTAEEIVRKWYKTWEVEKKDWGPFDVLLADNLPSRARPATTTSVRALSKRIAGIHRLILSDSLTWSGWSQVATRRLRSIFATRKTVNHSEMWSISGSKTGRWRQ
jgi:hypothetical protein